MQLSPQECVDKIIARVHISTLEQLNSELEELNWKLIKRHSDLGKASILMTVGAFIMGFLACMAVK